MKHCKWCDSDKPVEEFHKHKKMKDGRLNKCRTCVKEAVAQWRVDNPGCRAEEHARNAKKKGIRTRQEWRDDVAANAIGRKATIIKYSHKRRAQTQTVDELTEFAMEELAIMAGLREEATGFKWHIDHIVPLNHKEACGLHHYTNLKLVPALWNVRKGNRSFEEWTYE